MLLGLIQGFTEWLPISSSGHLVIAQQLLRITVPLSFDVALHLGTLLAVIIIFRKDVLKVLASLVKLDFGSAEGKTGLYVVVGTIPVAFAGYLFHDLIESMFSNLFVVAIAMIFTGILLFLTKFSRNKRKLTIMDSVFVGISQALSLVPGVSRSGITISTSLQRGIEKEQAVKFSFLLSIPAVLGASLFELKSVSIAEIGLPIIAGASIAAIVGFLAIKFLLRVIGTDKYYYFSLYCWAVGLALLAYLFLWGSSGIIIQAMM